MEKIYELLGNEAGFYTHLEYLQGIHRGKEKELPPDRKAINFGKLGEELHSKATEHVESVARSLVGNVCKELESVFSIEGLKTRVFELVVRDPSKLFLPGFIPYLVKALEDKAFEVQVRDYDKRLEGVGGQIGNWMKKEPEDFSPEKINVSKRFPVSRCVWDGLRWCDKDLSEALGGKLIPFAPKEKYIEALKKFHKEIYTPLVAKEERAKELEKKVVKGPEASPQMNPYTIPLEERLAFGLEPMTEEEPRRASRIYRGGKI